LGKHLLPKQDKWKPKVYVSAKFRGNCIVLKKLCEGMPQLNMEKKFSLGVS